MTAYVKKFRDPKTIQVTPWNPSHKAIARVKNPLPVPDSCPYCGDQVEIKENKVIFGRNTGEWPWIYQCADDNCDAYVGMHPFTHIPLGTLADQETRERRKAAKDQFNSLWQHGAMTRSKAYEWLAVQLGIPVDECHVGWSDINQCERIIALCQARTA